MNSESVDKNRNEESNDLNIRKRAAEWNISNVIPGTVWNQDNRKGISITLPKNFGAKIHVKNANGLCWISVSRLICPARFITIGWFPLQDLSPRQWHEIIFKELKPDGKFTASFGITTDLVWSKFNVMICSKNSSRSNNLLASRF